MKTIIITYKRENGTIDTETVQSKSGKLTKKHTEYYHNINAEIISTEVVKPVIIPVEIALDEQIMFNKISSMFVGRVVEIKEKAIKVDYYWQPIMSALMQCQVYNYSTWVPRSVLKQTDNGVSVKSWFATKFPGGHHIKKYFIEDGKKVLI